MDLMRALLWLGPAANDAQGVVGERYAIRDPTEDGRGMHARTMLFAFQKFDALRH